jgi:hypothetical protein
VTTKKLWPLEADPDDPNVPHATVKCANCPTHIFVAKDHPLLPDGPFFCPEHSDVPWKFEPPPGYTEADLICDRCTKQLTARGADREAALANLWKLVEEHQWLAVHNGAANDLCNVCRVF